MILFTSLRCFCDDFRFLWSKLPVVPPPPSPSHEIVANLTRVDSHDGSSNPLRFNVEVTFCKLCWTLKRSYDEFFALHIALQRRFSQLEPHMPPMPSNPGTTQEACTEVVFGFVTDFFWFSFNLFTFFLLS